MDDYGEGLDEFLVFRPVTTNTSSSSVTAETEGSSTLAMTMIQVSWTKNHTKIFLDFYKKYKPKVGTFHIKKLWEIIAEEMNKLLNTNLTPDHCENRWRVLERAFKKYIDNQNKTGQGRKYFEYIDEMNEIFEGKKNVKPTVLLSSSTIVEMPEPETDIENDIRSPKPSTSKPRSETPKNTASNLKHIKDKDSLKRKRTPVVNGNLTLVGMKKGRKEYQDARLNVEKEKLELRKRKIELMQERNQLLKERNNLLKSNINYFDLM